MAITNTEKIVLSGNHPRLDVPMYRKVYSYKMDIDNERIIVEYRELIKVNDFDAEKVDKQIMFSSDYFNAHCNGFAPIGISRIDDALTIFNLVLQNLPSNLPSPYAVPD